MPAHPPKNGTHNKNHKKYPCEVCKKEFTKGYLFPCELIRSGIADEIKKKQPNWNSKGYICHQDFRKFRMDYIEKILEEEKGELSELDQMVIESMRDHEVVAENINKIYETEMTFGERIAARVSKFGGSWPFIISFILFIGVWTTINGVLFMERSFDPFPFILLNLALSCLAALQAPVILMSQNRQAKRDRMQADDDYCTNLKTELEMRQLHAKMDLFIKKQWERLLEIQKIQIELAEELLEKKYKKAAKENVDKEAD